MTQMPLQVHTYIWVFNRDYVASDQSVSRSFIRSPSQGRIGIIIAEGCYAVINIMDLWRAGIDVPLIEGWLVDENALFDGTPI